MKPSAPSPGAPAPAGANGNPRAARPFPPRSGRIAPLLGFSVFALWFFLFAFQPGVPRSDDFGYLRSILGTLERGHPYTYEWLAPYGAVFSSVCAALYRLTGNFYLSAWGFQAFCALAVFPLLYRLLAARLRPGPAAALTLAFATFPLCFAKAADFHGSMSTLALFLGALLFFESGGIAGFFLAAFLALANRQSHLALLLLPAWSAAAAFRARRDPLAAFSGWEAWLAGSAFAAAAVALHLRMNRTYAMANAVFTGSGGGRILSVTLALAFGCFAAMACLAVCGAAFRSPWESLKANLRRPALPIASTLLLLAMARVWPPHLLMTDTPLFGFAGWPQVNAAAPWILIACAWFLDRRLLAPSPHAALIGGFILIACLRGVWWDYYFLEILAVCLLLAASQASREDPTRTCPAAEARAAWTRGGAVAVALLLAANLGYAYLLRVQMDKQKLSVAVLERLEREGRAGVDGMTGATFGYLGWKLFDYFLANEGRTYGELADFLGYVRRDRIVIETHVPWRRAFKGALPAQALLLDTGTCSIGFARLPYRVADLRGPDSALSIMGRPMSLDPARFRSPRWPLDNREWKVLIDSLSPGRPARNR
ncbi:MAG TPA: hypothetical protein VJ385_00675 [Fibrobacteria bacterium]|nr:hypothetical protein [Fibrobacteria bacterium]